MKGKPFGERLIGGMSEGLQALKKGEDLPSNYRPKGKLRTVIYHNPRCGKSRETLELLREKGIEPEIIEYLKTPPSAAELKSILKKLRISARELVRKKEPEYKKLKLDRDSLTEKQLIEAMIRHPILIERPIVLRGAKAALGRPPEKVLDILD